MHLVDTTMFYSPEGGGVRRYLMAKHDWLRKNTGVRHTILAAGGVDSVGSDAVVTLKSPPSIFSHGYRFPIRLDRWRKHLIKLAPDLIEVGDPFGPAWAALKAGQQLGVPVAGFYHSDLVRLVGKRFGSPAERATARYVRYLYRDFDLVIAPSHFIAGKLQALGIERVRHQPLGVDTDLFHPKRRDPALRRKLGLPEDARLLIYAGRFVHEKNLPVLLSAFRRLGRRYHLLLVGAGMHVHSRSNITIYGYQKNDRELARLIASCDALVHAGPQETFGLVVLEAMACGLPIVGVDEGGVAELVGEQHGILVQPGNSKAFAQGIEALYEQDLSLLGSRARENVAKAYSWNQVLRSLLALYQDRMYASRTDTSCEAYEQR